MALFAEGIVIFANAFPHDHTIPSHVYHTLCPRPEHNVQALQRIPASFVLGLVLALSGSAIRVWCYRVLGHMFTYEVSLRPTHSLVKCAPYSIVRHPSYTGVFLHFTGIAILHFSPGGWNRECGIMQTASGPWISLWLILSAYTFVSVWRRGDIEDAILREKFGSEWEQYRLDVPFKFIPWMA